jgi:hypothetical protein
MSDILKAQAMPQFNWYTHWTSLGTNGLPDKLIKEGLKQPKCIKVSYEKGQKKYTGHIAPDQARFRPEYFLALMLPDFKSRTVTQLSDTKKEDGPTLFSLMLMGQCFQDVGLTKCTNVVGKQ